MSLSLLVQLFITIIFLILLYIPTLTELLQLWWNDPNYSHGFLVPIISSYLIWNRIETSKTNRLKAFSMGCNPVAQAGFCCS